MAKRFDFFIDVIGSCNLKCPSCPSGNMLSAGNPRGAMNASELINILDKAALEVEIGSISLFNWTEPFLHYDISNLVRIANSYGPCHLSTNLNVFKNVESVMIQNPMSICVSVSGFSQENYKITHAKGNIEVVKENMIRLSEIKERLGVNTKLRVAYHRYLGNLDDEIKFRNFAKSLNFGFQANWAFFMPIEKQLAYISPGAVDANVTEDDLALISTLALPIDKAVKVLKPYRNRECTLQNDQMVINVQGEVMLCCGVYDSSSYSLGKFMNLTVDEIQAKKHSHSTCGKCKDQGLHVYGVYGAPELDRIALDEVSRYYESGAEISLSTVKHRSKLSKALIKRIPIHVLVKIRRFIDKLS